MSIHKNDSKVKQLLHSQWGIVIALIVLFISSTLTAYILGAKAAYSRIRHHTPIEIEYPPQVIDKHVIEPEDAHMSTTKDDNATETQGNGEYIASQNGARYYNEGCSGLSRIREENRIYFNSEQEAQNNGYSRAVNCDW